MDITLNAFTLIVTIVSILIALSVHEAMHAFTGYKLGDTTAMDEGRVSFNPLRHIDPFTTILLPIITLLIFKVPILAAKPVPFNPERVRYDEFGAALIALAGPLSNLVLAALGALLYHLIPANEVVRQAIEIFTTLNVALFVFNLIPIPPLDGSRVVYAFAPEPIQQFMAAIEPYGFFIIFGLVLLGSGFSQTIVSINQTILTHLL